MAHMLVQLQNSNGVIQYIVERSSWHILAQGDVPVPPPKPAQRALASFLKKWGSCSCTACAGGNSSTRATVLK